MKLHFRSIKLINFFSFESAEIILDNKGYTLVSGYNKNTEADIRSSIQALKTNTASTK